ncbi:MAG: hypothetical protein V4510_09905 [bacterium]
MSTREPKEDELYRLEGGGGWCRHGIVHIRNIGSKEKPDLVAVDTYWGAPNFGALEINFYPITPALKERLTFMLDLGTARRSHQDEYDVYADEDRAYIPMGGSSPVYYVRETARPNYQRQVARLERMIREERSKAESATRWADGYEKDLQALRGKSVHRPAVDGPCRPDCSICAAALAGTVVDAEVKTT